MRSKKWLPGLVALGGLTLFAACGELPVSKSIPDDIFKVAVPPFENKPGDPGLAAELTKRVIQELQVDGRIHVVPREQAEAVLYGTIQRYDRLVLTRDANLVPQQYKLQIIVDLDFVDLRHGKEERLWTTRAQISLTPGVEPGPQDFDANNTRTLREFTNYYVLNVAGVPPEDESIARDRLLDQMARRVARRTLEGF
jgi:hypothetical protein